MRRTVFFFFCVTLLCNVDGFPSGGVPPSVCLDLFPRHGLEQQTTKSPYVITLNQSEYSPGDVITIRVSSPQKKTFRGFVLRGRRLHGDTEQLVGEFIKYPNETRTLSFPVRQDLMLSDSLALGPPLQNCLCHSADVDRETLEVQWKAPNISVGDIEISGSFLHHFKEFWVASNELTLTSKEPQQEEHYQAKISVTEDLSVSVEECGQSKGCLVFPTGCHGNSCRYVVSYKVDQDNNVINFEIKAWTNGYASVSITRDRKMGDDETMTCIQGNGMADFQYGYNMGYSNQRQLRHNFRNIIVSRQGEILTCRYSRPLVMNFRNESFNLSNSTEEFYLVLARGDLYNGTTAVKRHNELPLISHKKVNFHQHTITYGSTLPIYYLAHAAMAIVSWIMLGCASIVLARHFKGPLRQKLCGAEAWLLVHRAIGVIITGLTIGGTVLIFLYLKKWTEYATMHAILGLMANALVLVQFTGALLRPEGNHVNRPRFTWVHRIGGIGALIAAVISVLLGFNVSLIERGLASKEMTLVVIWIVYHILFDVFFEIIKYRNKEKEQENTKPTRKDGKQEGIESTHNDGSHEENRLHKEDSDMPGKHVFTLFAFYIIGNLVFCGVALDFLLIS